MKNIFHFLFVLYSFNSLAITASVEWQRFFSPPALETQTRDYAFFKWDQDNKFMLGPFQWEYHFKTQFSLNSRAPIAYFNLSELSFFYRYDLLEPLYSVQAIELGMGRTIKNWSFADSYWDMGLWNPLTRWNPLHPSDNGLVGAFLTLHSDQWSFDSLLGALYLPNQERQFLEKEGRFYSHSRWFSSLPSQVGILGQNYLDIYYLAERPFLFEVLFQPSYLASFKMWYNYLNAYYWMKWSFADKPVNHLYSVLSKDEVFSLSDEEDTEGVINQQITLIPVRQRLVSAEWGFDYRRYTLTFSVENTRMKEGDIKPKGWEFLNRRENFTYFSLLMKYRLSPFHFVRVGYLQSWFHNYSLVIGKSNGKSPSILQRYVFLQGVSFDWKADFFSSQGLKRSFSLGYRWSFLNEGSWLSAKLLYYISPEFYTSLTLDVLGSEKEKGYFLTQFRHNDYFSWSWAYVF